MYLISHPLLLHMQSKTWSYWGLLQQQLITDLCNGLKSILKSFSFMKYFNRLKKFILNSFKYLSTRKPEWIRVILFVLLHMCDLQKNNIYIIYNVGAHKVDIIQVDGQNQHKIYYLVPLFSIENFVKVYGGKKKPGQGGLHTACTLVRSLLANLIALPCI